MPLLNPDVIEQIFTYHPPTTEEQKEQYVKIRQAAKEFALTILANTSSCADQSATIRHIREAVMTANASIALNGLV